MGIAPSNIPTALSPADAVFIGSMRIAAENLVPQAFRKRLDELTNSDKNCSSFVVADGS